MKQAWVVALLLIPAVIATGTINTADTTVILEGDTAEVESSFILIAQEPIGNLTIILASDSDDVEILIDEEEKDCLVQAEFARCGNLSVGEYIVKVSYETDYPVAQVGENTLVRYTDLLPYPAQTHKVTLKLPVGYIIPQERGKDESFYISPEPKEVYSDGQRIILYWEQSGQELPISVVTRKVIKAPIGWIASTAVFMVLAATVTILFILHTNKKQKKAKQAPNHQRKKEIIVPNLIDNEQKVVDFLKQKGEVWQKQIQAATGFSKAKVSRIIRNLEERGIVTKTIYGNTNKISLKK